MNNKFTSEENKLLKQLFIPNWTEDWEGIKIKNEEIALLDFVYGAIYCGQIKNAKLATTMLAKCNPEIVKKLYTKIK